ncbi:MAG: hypothetical protein G01um1014107_129 [Parcubacteria group bacterium Gr01-1014_107]|nr:MAG: hypothetical protein G01um1014107_129 [Parcubacteria group bacterium Gr01-1014_107]
MENHTQSSSLAPTDLERKRYPVSSIITFTILGLQAGSIVVLARFIAFDRASGGMGLGIVPFIFLFTIVFVFLGVVGLIYTIQFWIRKKTHTIPLIVLILTSILMLTMVVPGYLARMLSPIFLPRAEKKLEQSIEQARQSYSDSKKTHYDILSKEFQRPQKIIDARYQNLVLEDGKIVKLFGFSWRGDGITPFEEYAKQSLVGKSIKIDLPTYTDFAEYYIPSLRSGLFKDYEHMWLRDPEINVLYGEIPVLIYIDNILINADHTGSEGGRKWLLQKYNLYKET